MFERARDGREIDWGEILEWNPPRSLSYLWHIAAPRDDATVVRIEFYADDSLHTRIEIEHSGWERLGDRGPDWRNRNVGGWNGVLPVFREACQARD